MVNEKRETGVGGPQKPTDLDAHQDAARDYRLAYQWLSGYDPRSDVVVRERFAEAYVDLLAKYHSGDGVRQRATPEQFYAVWNVDLSQIIIPFNPPPNLDWFVSDIDRRLRRVETQLQRGSTPLSNRCASCDSELTPVFIHADPGVYDGQYKNALELRISGGYGMFIDDSYHIFLCHGCAHVVCDVLPWLNRLLQPQTSHMHEGIGRD